MGIKFKVQQERYKIAAMVSLLGICCFLTYYFHFILKSHIIFTHFFYIPIILAALWWKKKGLGVAIFLALLVLATHRLGYDFSMFIVSDIFRATFFIVISSVVAVLSGRVAKVEEELQKLNQEMEQKVEERTKQLAKERNYVRHLMESSPDFQMTLDMEGRIKDVNEAFEEIVGKKRDDIVGKFVYEYLPKEEAERAIAEILEKKKLRNIELRTHITAKGDLILDLSGTVFTTKEGGEGIYISGRDMTELREKRLQLIHTERLSSLGEMAAGVAHEINQPLSIISMAAEGTLRDIKEKRFDINMLPGELEDIMRNVGRIDQIITHMRTFARKPEEWRPVEPEEALNNAFILLGAQLKIHGIIVSIKTEDNLPLIQVDSNQLEQVFVNILIIARQVLDKRGEEAKRSGEDFEPQKRAHSPLLVGAKRRSRPSGAAGLASDSKNSKLPYGRRFPAACGGKFQKKLACEISRKKENEHEWLVFEFADNAYGVPDNLKEKIFEPFFTTKEAGEGTGLGLSIVYDIITRSLGGRIFVEDNEMGGASFKVAVKVKN